MAEDRTLISGQTPAQGRQTDVETSKRLGKNMRRQILVAGTLATGLLVLAVACSVWVGTRANVVKGELESALQLVPQVKEDIASNDPARSKETVDRLRLHTRAAREAAEDPVWTLASALPRVGPNLNAIAEVARAADDVSTLGVAPLVDVFSSLHWEGLVPGGGEANVEPLKQASPTVVAAAHAVRASADRLNGIDTSQLIAQVAEPLTRARSQMTSVVSTLDAAADASRLIPTMLGTDGSRSYLVMVQNNAESRSSGGIPGALAVLEINNGNLVLGAQGSATSLGVITPAVQVDPAQTQIYSGRLGKFFQDVNLTPDFPTAASTAQLMWKQETGQQVDGVISVDPVALSFILGATGPVEFSNPSLVEIAKGKLPTQLREDNVVQTLLSDVYANIDDPKQQDAYFAGVAQDIFFALSAGKGDAKDLVSAVTRGAEERRLMIWSAHQSEQSVLGEYALSGSLFGPSVAPAQFGVYFNDGTGAKMDYYVRRSVQLLKECPKDGYEQTTVRIISTNTAPSDAATSLPAYVTGSGHFGVPAGSVQTNIVAYGPVQANVETASQDGSRTDFAPYIHGSRPVGVLAVRLAPGETKTVEFTFGKIVQHAEPKLVVTPTIQPVNDVTLDTEIAVCG